MILSRFSNGGFVVHKAVDGRTSGWFDANGKLLDCERRDRLNRWRRPSAAIRARLEVIGRVHATSTKGASHG